MLTAMPKNLASALGRSMPMGWCSSLECCLALLKGGYQANFVNIAATCSGDWSPCSIMLCRPRN
jgi:hypothetical protein